jgi:hypothetical protein
MTRPLLLSCEAVSKAYGTRSLFDDLSFGLFEGDQAGLVGPNGAGKSTLLKILTGDETPDAVPGACAGVRSVTCPGSVPPADRRGSAPTKCPGRRREDRSAPAGADPGRPASVTAAGGRHRRELRKWLASRASSRRVDIHGWLPPTTSMSTASLAEGLLTERARVPRQPDRYFWSTWPRMLS